MSNRQKLVAKLGIAGALIGFIIYILVFTSPIGSSPTTDITASGALNALSEVMTTPSVVGTSTGTVIATSTVSVVDYVTSTVIWRGKTVVTFNRRYILEGKTTEEIADYIVQRRAHDLLGAHGPIQIRLARPVTIEEVWQLGITCMYGHDYEEEAPYVLVIVQGNFDLSGLPGTRENPGMIYHYSALVVDVWVAEVTSVVSSNNGAHFRHLLNDPNIPEMTPEPRGDCPTPIPGDLPHGRILPTTGPNPTSAPYPPEMPGPTRTLGPTRTPAPIPSPVSTQGP